MSSQSSHNLVGTARFTAYKHRTSLPKESGTHYQTPLQLNIENIQKRLLKSTSQKSSFQGNSQVFNKLVNISNKYNSKSKSTFQEHLPKVDLKVVKQSFEGSDKTNVLTNAACILKQQSRNALGNLAKVVSISKHQEGLLESCIQSGNKLNKRNSLKNATIALKRPAKLSKTNVGMMKEGRYTSNNTNYGLKNIKFTLNKQSRLSKTNVKIVNKSHYTDNLVENFARNLRCDRTLKNIPCSSKQPNLVAETITEIIEEVFRNATKNTNAPCISRQRKGLSKGAASNRKTATCSSNFQDRLLPIKKILKHTPKRSSNKRCSTSQEVIVLYPSPSKRKLISNAHRIFKTGRS